MRILRGGSWLFRENEVLCSCVLPVHASFADVGLRIGIMSVDSVRPGGNDLYLDVNATPTVKERPDACCP
jgi:hypothetical protein